MPPDFGVRTQWRNTGLIPKFFVIDYHAFAPLFLATVKWNKYLFYFALVCVAFLIFIKIWSITPIALVRFIRIKLAGTTRYTETSPMTIHRRIRW